MNITLLTYGSRGDVQPFIALAVGLQQAGHSPLLAAPGRFASLAAEYQIPFVALAGDPAEISKGLNDAGSNPYRMIASINDYVLSVAPQVLSQISEACAQADLIVHGFLFTTGGHSLARKLGIPDISVQLFPMFAPTGDYPNVAFPDLGRTWNYFTHWFATQVFWFGGNSGLGRVRRLLPDSFPKTLTWPFRGPHPTPLLFACSPSVIPPSTDWPAHIHVPGYFFLDDGHPYQPPVELVRFLEAGPAPICVSFGSMLNREAQRIDAIVRDAIAESGNRAVILTGWNASISSSFDKFLYMDAAPHAWLFPQCKAVVHHGGAGTTGAGLRAGVPNIVIPHAADQPFWGRRVAALGAGPAPISVNKLNASRLLTALATAEDPTIISVARAVGRRIRVEDGVGAAVRLIEQTKATFSLTDRNL